MSDTYSTDVDIPVSIISDPESGKWIEDPNMLVKVHCMTDGMTILSYKYGVSSLSIPISYLTLRKVDGYTYEIDNNTLSRYIQTQLKELSINHIEDISRTIKISKASDKRVPIKPDITATYATQHMNTAGKIILEFDSVTIRAPQIILDTINSICTEKIIHNDLSTSIKANADLIIPDNTYCKYSEIRYEIPVDRFTQFKFKAKVHSSAPSIIGYLSGGSGIHWNRYSGKVTTIPEEVTVFVNLPMSAKSKEKNIVAYIDFDKDNKDSKYEVQLSGIPKGSEIVAIEPRIVDAFKDIR